MKYTLQPFQKESDWEFLRGRETTRVISEDPVEMVLECWRDEHVDFDQRFVVQLNLQEVSKLAEQNLDYNDFAADVMGDLAELMFDRSIFHVYFGREGSPVLYVPDLDERELRNLFPTADERHVFEDRLVLDGSFARLWWD